MKYKHLPGTVISPKKPRGAEKWCKGWLVQVAVSSRGVVCIDGECFAGFKVDPPIVPDGFKLHSIHCGAELNCKPPMLSMYLEPLNRK